MTDNDVRRWALADTNSLSFDNGIYDQLYYTSTQRNGAKAAQIEELADGRVISNSDMHAIHGARQNGYPVSKQGMEAVSNNRQEYLRELNERHQENNYRPQLSLAEYVPSRERQQLNKYAVSNTPSQLGASTSTVHLAPEIYSPLFLTQNLQLPRDRVTANAWNRAFYETNPIVRNAINLHATYPISKLNIKCEDKYIENFFIDMCDKIDLLTVVQNCALEFWKMGEVLNYASFDEATGTWDKMYQLNPDFVSVKASPIPGTVSISLKPDPELQKIIMSPDPEHVKIREQLDEKIVHHVIMNEYIPLDNFNVSHLKNLASPYDIRGTSTLVAVWKDLMLYDKLREAKFVQADGMINPLTLVKLGSSNPDGFYPRQQELEAWRSILEQAQFDRDFKIVTHDAVSVERIGFNGAVLDVAQDFQMIIDNILMGLMVPKSVLNQDGATFASASVGLDVMRQRYNSFRAMIANWLERKIFAPISEVQGFYKHDSGTKRLIVPEIEWNQMTLYDVDTYIAHISNLVNQQSASKQTLYRSLGLNRKNELINMRQEAIEDAILQKEKESLSTMSLGELRALDPEQPIVEPEQALLPGQAPGAPPLPGGPGGPGGLPPLPPMPGGGAGGMPPMPGPGGPGGLPPGGPAAGPVVPPGGAPGGPPPLGP